ncbi:Superkiller protein 3 [Entophlyctis luteolus]|nr:Superkiller protein 3 [Entophlyctis luteolus]
MDSKKKVKAAKDAIAASDYARARDLAESVVAAGSTEPESIRFNALLLKGLACQNLADFATALTSYKDALALNPDSAIPRNALVALFEKSGDEDALHEAIQDLWMFLLTQYEITPHDTRKLSQISQRLIDRFETGSDWYEALRVIEQLLSPSLAETAAILGVLSLARKALRFQEEYDSETRTKEIEVRRRRLGASDLATTAKQVEAEIVAVSKLDSYCSYIISASTDTAEIAAVKQTLLEFLVKKIKLTPGPQKPEMFSRIRDLSEEMALAKQKCPIAYDILINSSNCGTDDIDAVSIEAAAKTIPDSAIGHAAKSYLQWKSSSSAIDALDGFLTAFEEDPNCLFVSLMLSRLYSEMDDFESASVFCKKSEALLANFQISFGVQLERTSTHIDLLLAEAYTHLGPKFLPTSLTLYSKILTTDPLFSPALYGFANALCLSGRFQDAQKELEKLMEIKSNDDMAISLSGWCAFLSDNVTQAFDLVSQALKIRDCALHNFRMGKILWRLEDGGRKSEAYRFLIKCVKQDPGHHGAFTAIGQFCLEVENNPVRARKCFEKALDVNFNDEEAVLSLVKLMLSNEEVIEAKARLNEFISTETTATKRSALVWRYLGFTSLATEEFSDSITQFQTSLRLDTGHALSWEGLGDGYAATGKYTAALKAFTRAYDLLEQAGSKTTSALFSRAGVSMKIGMFSAAIADLELALKCTVSASSEHAIVYVRLAECWFLQARDSWNTGGCAPCMGMLMKAAERCLDAIEAGCAKQTVFKLLGDVCVSVYVWRSNCDLVKSHILERAVRTLGEIEMPNNVYMAALIAAARSYRTALKLSDGSAFESVSWAYFNDLALAYNFMYQLSFQDDSSNGEGRNYLKMSIATVAKALQSNQSNEDLWISLGVLTYQSNARLSQHAFVKALELNEKSVESWINIGFLFYSYGDLDLARQAFNRVQLIDPENCLGWYGHALINAQQPTSEKVLDHFDQANELSQGKEIEVSFSYALSAYEKFATSGRGDRDPTQLIDPTFSMLKFNEIREDDVAALTLQGLLYELQGRFDLAVEAFSRGLSAARQQQHPKEKDCLANYARGLLAAGFYSEAVGSFSELFEESNDPLKINVLDKVGHGVALFFCSRLEESLTSFQDALDALALTEDPKCLVSLQNKVSIMLSAVLYALGTDVHVDLAKEQLMECVRRPNGCPEALISLLALGIVTRNDDLSHGAASELVNASPELMQGFESERNMILSKYFLLQGSTKLSRGFLARTIHQSPWKSSPWTELADNIARYSPEISNPLITVAQSAIVLQQFNDKMNDTRMERARAFQTLGHAILIRAPFGSKTLSVARSWLHSSVHIWPSNSKFWFSLGVSTHRDAIAAEDPTKKESLAASTQKIAVSAKSLAECSNDDAEALWSSLLLTDSQLLHESASNNSDTLGSFVERARSLENLAPTVSIDPGLAGTATLVLARALSRSMHLQSEAVDMFRLVMDSTVLSENAALELGSIFSRSHAQYDNARECFIRVLDNSDTLGATRIVAAARLALAAYKNSDDDSFTTAMTRLRELQIEDRSDGDSSNAFKLFMCLSLMKGGGNSAAMTTRCKKIVNAALEVDPECAWARWVASVFDVK